MSETMQNVRRTASYSVGLFKTAAGLSGAKMTDAALEPANELTEASASARSEPTTISAKTEMKGSITTTEAVQVRGKIEGDVHAAAITVLAGGEIKGDVTADVVIVYGCIEGRIQAQDVRLCAGAVVSGEIMHGSLGIDTAAVFEGTIKRIAAGAVSAA